MQIETILWDNDGVLVDTETLYFRACRETLDEVGFELTEDLFREVSMRQGKSTIHLAESLGLSVNELEALRLKRNDRYTELLRQGVRVMTGIEETLRDLRDNVRMGVVTSSRKDHFDIIHEQTGLLRYFDFVLTHADFEQSKPHPECYLRAIDRFQVDVDTALVVEDTERGLQAATDAGLRCVVIPNELTKGMDFSRAWAVLGNARELLSEVVETC